VSLARILVIAPNPDFRRSLVFALEAEGCVVTSVPEIPASDFRGFDVVVLDHRAAKGSQSVVIDFCRRAPPLILLAGSPKQWLVERACRVVQTPVVGDALIRAVRDGVGRRGDEAIAADST
jgi:CheY-like chemotaxis protein